MKAARIEVDIGELVLDGVAPDDVDGLPAAIEEHLAALAGGTAPAPTGGSGLAGQIARAVWDRLPADATTATGSEGGWT